MSLPAAAAAGAGASAPAFKQISPPDLLPPDVVTLLAQQVFKKDVSALPWQSTLPEKLETGIYLVVTEADPAKQIERTRTIYVVRAISQKVIQFFAAHKPQKTSVINAFHFSANQHADILKLQVEIAYQATFLQRMEYLEKKIEEGGQEEAGLRLAYYKALQSRFNFRISEADAMQPEERFCWKLLPEETVYFLAAKCFGVDFTKWDHRLDLPYLIKKTGVYLRLTSFNNMADATGVFAIEPYITVRVAMVIPVHVNHFFNPFVNEQLQAFCDFDFSLTDISSHKELSAEVERSLSFSKVLASLELSIATSTGRPTAEQELNYKKLLAFADPKPLAEARQGTPPPPQALGAAAASAEVMPKEAPGKTAQPAESRPKTAWGR